MSGVTVVPLRSLVFLVLVALMLSLSSTGCGGGSKDESTVDPKQEELKAKYLETHPPPSTKPAKKGNRRN